MRNLILSFLFILTSVTVAQGSEVAKLILYKSERRLILVDKKENILHEFTVMLGAEPIGAKERQGDNKTPEGTYILDYKNPKSKFYKSIHVNYPNKKDIANAKRKKIKDPGDSIMIHGLPNDLSAQIRRMKNLGFDNATDSSVREELTLFDWTQGCIALIDSDMEIIYKSVKTPTPIIIYP